MSDRYDVVVVGAGVAGCSAAMQLASDREVLLVDRSGVASEATGRSAGVVAPTLFWGTDFPEAVRYANAFFRELDGTGAFEFTERHRLDLIPEGEAERAREDVAELDAEGFPVAWLDAADVVERFPRFEPAGMAPFAGAVRYGDAGWVDPHTYANALEDEARRRGADVEYGTDVESVLESDGRVTGVETSAGVRRADHVVVAAGWWTAPLLEEYLAVPIRPYRTQCVVLSGAEPLEESFPIARIGSERLYFRPERDGTLLVGGHHELLDHPREAATSTDESFRRAVAGTIGDLLSGFEAAGVVEGWAGVDSGTPDGRPIVDAPAAAPDGLVVATGFNGLGVTFSPVAGRTVRALVDGEAPGFPVEPFALERFDERSREFELRSTSEL